MERLNAEMELKSVLEGRLYDADQDRSILLNSAEWHTENMEFCTSAAIISASNGSHVALSQYLRSFLFKRSLKCHSKGYCLMKRNRTCIFHAFESQFTIHTIELFSYSYSIDQTDIVNCRTLNGVQ